MATHLGTRDRMLRDVGSVVIELTQIGLGGSPRLCDFAAVARATTAGCDFVEQIEAAFEAFNGEAFTAPPRPGSTPPPASVETTPDPEPNPQRPRWEDPATGILHRGLPDEAECWVEDYGQHDVHKHDMFVWLWRARRGIAGPVDLQELGLTTRRQMQSQGATVYPMPEDLARACQRLGFARLALAVNDNAGLGLAPDELRLAWTSNENAVRGEAERRRAVNDATAAGWDAERMGGPHVAPTVAETISMLTAGPFDGPAVPPNRTLQPLNPWRPAPL